MSPALTAAGLAMLGGVPLAALGWSAAAATERLTRDPRLRERAWSLALHLPLLAAAVAAAAASRPVRIENRAETTAAAEISAIVDWAEIAPAAGGWSLDPVAVGTGAFAAALLGAGVRVLLVLVGASRAARLVKRSEPLGDPAALALAGRGAARLGLPRPEVRVSGEVGAPILAGLRRPVVLLPEALVHGARPDALALVCVHELVHQRRGDNLRLLLEEVVLGALWFNPAAYAARAGLRAAREEACDALALAAEPPAVRRLYAETLVRSLRLRAGPELQPAFTGARRRTKMRLHALLHPAEAPRRTRRLLAGGLLAGLLASAGGAALALADAAPKPTGPLGLHLTPEPEFLKAWVRADRSSGMREAVDVYSGGVELAGRAPAAYPVTVNGRPAAPEQDLAALGPVDAVQVRREATTPFGPKPRILQADIRLAQADVAQPPAAPAAAPGAAAPPVITRPDWAALPSGEDLARLYPAAARAAGVSGRATIGCSVLADGQLTGCKVVSEAPEAAGFGAATLALSERFRMKPQTVDGRPVEGAVVRVPVLWRLGDDAPPSAAAVSSTNNPSALAGVRQPAERPMAVTARTFTQLPGPPPVVRYTGEVRINGRGPASGARVTVDGRPVSADLDLATLGQVESLEIEFTPVTAASPERQQVTAMRITTGR